MRKIVVALTLVCAVALVSAQSPISQGTGPITNFPFSFINGGGVANGPVLHPDGTAAAPSVSFTTNTNRGLFNDTANAGVGVTVAGAQTTLFSAGGIFNVAGPYQTSSSGTFAWTNGTALGGSADLVLGRAAAGILNITNNGGTPDFNISVSGAPALSTCGDGALQTGSSNSSGRVVGTTQTACTLTFSATFGGNSADCFIENITANRGNVTAASATAFTVSNLTAGDDFMYFCVGR